MKKLLLLSLSLCLATGVFAQKTTKPTDVKSKPISTKAASSSSAAPTSGTAPVASNADCYINKTWKLSKVEKFGIEKDPTAEQKNDMLQLNSDGTFKMTINGVEKSGNWTRGTYMSLKPSDGSEMLPVKIESCEGSTLKVDWRDGDTHNHFTYSF